MDKDRDEFLNELIEYYDGEPKKEPAPQSPPPPQEEGMGNTVVVNLRKKAVPEPKPVPEETIKVETPPEKTKPEPVEEEVLGNLDINGRPLPQRPAQTINIEQTADASGEFRSAANNKYSQPENTEEEPPRKTGIWHSLKPLWVTIILCLIAAAGLKFYITDTGPIGIYKRNFNYNMNLLLNMFGVEWNYGDYLPVVGKAGGRAAILSENEPVTTQITQGNSYTERDNEREAEPELYTEAGSDKTVIPFSDAGDSDFEVYNNGIVCAKSNYLCYITDNGRIKWESETSVSSPILAVSGKYEAIASNGGTRLSLYKNGKLKYTTEVPNAIRACEVSSRGDVALVTDKPAYKGAVLLINSKGELVFSWSSGVNYITAAAVLKNRRIAVALSSTERQVTSFVMMFDIKSTEPLSGAEMQNSLIYRLNTDGKVIFADGDNSISLINAKSNVKYDLRFDSAKITHSAADNKGNRLLSCINNNLPIMNLYSKSGELTDSFSIEGVPDFIDVYKSTVLYNNGHYIICGNAGDEKKTRYAAPRTVKGLMLLNSGSYAAVYEDSIEIVRF